MVIERTYPKLSQIVKSKFELGRVKQINPASDHGITEQAPRVLWTPAMANKFQGRGITRNLIQDWITPIILTLATALRDKPQVCWEDRLRRDNHTPFLPTVVTGAIDTGPLYVCQPKRRRNARLLFQPKYHACVYKMQLIVSFLGHIIGYTGLHNGVDCDKKIWDRTRHLFPMADGELLLADGIDGQVRR